MAVAVSVAIPVPISVALLMLVVAVSLLAFISHRVTLEIVGIGMDRADVVLIMTAVIVTHAIAVMLLFTRILGLIACFRELRINILSFRAAPVALHLGGDERSRQGGSRLSGGQPRHGPRSAPVLIGEPSLSLTENKSSVSEYGRGITIEGSSDVKVTTRGETAASPCLMECPMPRAIACDLLIVRWFRLRRTFLRVIR